MDDERQEFFQKLNNFINNYQDILSAGIEERWLKLPIKLYDKEIYEVIGGLLARQATLSMLLASSPYIWNGHIAPIILRVMTDAHITLAWILKDPPDRVKKYIHYGLGQEKLFIEHLKAGVEENDDEDIKKLIKYKEEWLESQRREFLTEVNVGSWSGLGTREMANEADCDSLYKYAYAPFSGATHNMWQHISRFNLKYCKNPLHKYHKIPSVDRASLDPDYLYRSAKYVDKSFALVDKIFGLTIDTSMPLNWFIEEFDKLFEQKKTDVENKEDD
ncbi:MAG: hypothetical protein KKF54_00945 [Candidatus Omnitrophica bacterium]|nr:hypothetical protein [Candidatus Omnitrophota bacterium]